MRHSQLIRALGDGARPLLEPRLEELLALGLTAREAEVMRLAAAGRTDRQIAAALQISHRTVQKHLQRCYSKLHVGDRAEASATVLAAQTSREGPPPPGGSASIGSGEWRQAPTTAS